MALARWQAETLRNLAGECDFLVYSCRNRVPQRRRFRHAAYYLLNLFTIRNGWTRRIALPPDLPVIRVRRFDAEPSGSWQRLPGELLDQIRQDRPVAIVKFGMGLLEIPGEGNFGIPILSYHHGDPTQFRGRPAGFYEMLGGAPVMGQVVQRLSNVLDAGDILASAETKVLPHSYRATLVEAYRHSPLILARALKNCLAGDTVRPDGWGWNYRLPGNGLVLEFLLRQLRHAVSRLLYGLFREKRWAVATVSIRETSDLESLQEALARPSDWRILATPPSYRFLADPFLHPERGLLVEGLNARSCRGEILGVAGDEVERLSGRGGHYSYPATVMDGGRWYVVPEISDWASARALPLDDDGLGTAVELRVPGRPALLDPTPFRHEGITYLFGNLASEGASVLRLWMSESLRGEFVEHSSSPIRISPNGARMAGGLCRIGPKLLRFGQDFRGGYGDGLTVFDVMRIDARDYCEEAIRDVRFVDRRGPHTLNIGRGEAAFDFYTERFSLLAGLWRWRERRAACRMEGVRAP